MILRTIYIILFFLIVNIFQYCSVKYSFTGASIPPEAKTVRVKYFENHASFVQPLLSQSFTEALKDKILSQTRLNLVDAPADINFEGEIRDYRVEPVGIKGDETASINRLTITVRVKFINTVNPEQNFDATFSSYADYESSEGLDAVEDQLIETINDKLTDDIFNRAFTNW